MRYVGGVAKIKYCTRIRRREAYQKLNQNAIHKPSCAASEFSTSYKGKNLSKDLGKEKVLHNQTATHRKRRHKNRPAPRA
jgi:hypothetical protein